MVECLCSVLFGVVCSVWSIVWCVCGVVWCVEYSVVWCVECIVVIVRRDSVEIRTWWEQHCCTAPHTAVSRDMGTLGHTASGELSSGKLHTLSN